jgi:hypothetical protein
LGATEHRDFIEATLEINEKSLDDVLFLVGDNCSTNLALAELCGIPLVGCASHRLNLAVQPYADPFELIFVNVNQPMAKLKTA